MTLTFLFAASVFMSGTAGAVPLKYLLSVKPKTVRKDIMGDPMHSNARFRNSSPFQTEPLIPFRAFGLRFDEDLMMALNDKSGWGMLEVAKVDTPLDGPVWFTLDSKADGRQNIGLSKGQAAQELARSFPGTPYEADLNVREEKRDGGKREFTVNYTRIDGRPIAFKMIAEDKDKPPRHRNGNAMNHAQDQAMALMDLSSIHLTKPKWLDAEPLDVQSILFKPISARMRQIVFGLKEGDWIQSELTIHEKNRKWTLEKTELESMIILSKPGFPRTDYVFDKKNGFIELRRIEIHQALKGEADPIASMAFNPSLPDFRFGSPMDSFCAKTITEINGRKGYQIGKTCVNKVDNETRITLESESPSWAWQRPIVSWMSVLGRVRSTVMTPHEPQITTFSMPLPPVQQSIWVPESIDFWWKKRPHRTARLRAMPPEVNTLPQMTIAGGTWANGRFAKDQAVRTMRSLKVEGLDFYTFNTPQIPLRPIINGSKNRVEGHMRIALTAEDLPEGAVLEPGVIGFDFESGPQHSTVGMTLKGIGFSVSVFSRDDEKVVLDVKLAQNHGDVPDRIQNSEFYSAMGRLKLVLMVASTDTPFVSSSVLSSKTLKSGLFKSAAPREKGSGSSGIWRSYELSVADNSKHSGRYWRRILMSSSTDASEDIIDNAGWITRETNVRIEKETLWHDALIISASEKYTVD